MPSCRVTVLVKSVTVNSNGKPPAAPGQTVTGNNSVTASINYPRGGQPQLSAMTQANLQNGVPFQFNMASFYGPNNDGKDAPGLFKTEQIDDEAPMTVQVTASSDPGILASTLEKIFAGLLNTAAGLAPGGQFVVAAAQSLAGALGDQMSAASGSKVKIIGQAALFLRVSDLLAGKNIGDVVLPLIAQDTIHDQWLVPTQPAGGGPITWTPTEADLTVKGQPNGTLTLHISIS